MNVVGNPCSNEFEVSDFYVKNVVASRGSKTFNIDFSAVLGSGLQTNRTQNSLFGAQLSSI